MTKLLGMEKCTCRIPDWRKFREALRLTQDEMAGILFTNQRQIRRFEEEPHQCPKPIFLVVLRGFLTNPVFQKRLAEAEYADPYPEDPNRENRN